MKRFIILLAVLILAFAAAACGNSVQSYQMNQSGGTVMAG